MVPPLGCGVPAGGPGISAGGRGVVGPPDGFGVGRRIIEDHPAALEDQRPVGEFDRPAHVVGGEEHRRPALAGRAHHPGEPLPRRAVEPGERLVEEQQVRLVEEGAGERRPLGGAPREVARRDVGDRGEAVRLQQRADVRPGPVEPAVEVEVLPDRQFRVEERLVGREPDPAARRRDRVLQFHPAVADGSRRRARQGGGHPDQGGLPGAVRPEESDDLPGGHREAHLVHHRDFPVAPGDAVGLEEGGGHGVFRASSRWIKWRERRERRVSRWGRGARLTRRVSTEDR